MTETMLRELLQEYAADEPPLRLMLADVVAEPSSRPVRRPLAASRERISCVAWYPSISGMRTSIRTISKKSKEAR